MKGYCKGVVLAEFQHVNCMIVLFGKSRELHAMLGLKPAFNEAVASMVAPPLYCIAGIIHQGKFSLLQAHKVFSRKKSCTLIVFIMEATPYLV